MKKRRRAAAVFVAAVLVMAAAPGFGDAQFRMAGNAAVDVADKPAMSDLQSSLDDPASFFYGGHWEVITGGSVGFGMHGLTRFTAGPMAEPVSDLDNWWMDWNGDLFISFHLFGGGAVVDPFLEIGYGCAGRVELTQGPSGYWSQGDDGLWTYTWYPESYEPVTNMSLYPCVAAGVAFDLDGFLIGIRGAYRPVAHAIPATRIPNYPLKSVQISFIGGLALGGHDRRRW